MLGPLATYAEPHTYDLCADHATRLTAPRGWDIVRLNIDMTPPDPTPDDLVALAEAVRQAAKRGCEPEPEQPVRQPTRTVEASDPALLTAPTRKRHLRALPTQNQVDSDGRDHPGGSVDPRFER